MAALEAAATAMNTVSLVSLADAEIEEADATAAFATAEGKIKTCFSAYKVSRSYLMTILNLISNATKLGDWNKEAESMSAALERDKKLVDQMKATFTVNKVGESSVAFT